MNRLLRSLTLAAVLGWPLSAAPASAASARDCRQAALAHLRAMADGAAIYEQTAAPDDFVGWLRCDDPQFALPTAVHETTHRITAETDAFPLVGGGSIARPHEVSDFFQPHRIAKGFKTDDFAAIYLKRGKASSSTDFLYLLDEFNAYTHDLNAAVDLKDLKATDMAVDHRDGLAAMMAFVVVYAETARAKDERTWSGLQKRPVARTIQALWSRAERVMASSCGIPRFGLFDKMYLQKVCAAGPQSALAQILGHAPVCPSACLTSPGEDAVSGDDAAISGPAIQTAARIGQNLSAQK